MVSENEHELSPFTDEFFMKAAFQEAVAAFEKKEVPVGAVVVSKNKIIARSHNLTELLNDVTAHAEMQAFTSAAEFLGGKYLHQCTLYVTVEPCVMCSGASYWTQIDRIVVGTKDKKRGASQLPVKLTHPKTKLKTGILEQECADLMQKFFKQKRS